MTRALSFKQAAGILLGTAVVDASSRQLAQQRLAATYAPIDAPAAAQVAMVLTVLPWLGTLVASLFLFLALHRRGQVAAAFTRMQLSAAVGLAVVLPAPVLAIVAWLLGLPIEGWFAGWPLLVILWLFGPSVLAVPPEFLAPGYRTWIYSWIPFRYTFDALQGLLFYEIGAGETGRNVWIVGLYGLLALTAVLASVRRLRARDLTIHPLARRFQGAQAPH